MDADKVRGAGGWAGHASVRGAGGREHARTHGGEGEGSHAMEEKEKEVTPWKGKSREHAHTLAHVRARARPHHTLALTQTTLPPLVMTRTDPRVRGYAYTLAMTRTDPRLRVCVRACVCESDRVRERLAPGGASRERLAPGRVSRSWRCL